MSFYVYILRCSDGSFYTGWTTDPKRRLDRHNAGTGSRYTRSRRPVTLVYCRECTSRNEAMRQECLIKKMRHPEKQRLIDEKRLSFP